MLTGEPVTAAPGRTQNKLLDMSLVLVANGVGRAEWLPLGRYQGRNYALFVNGTWRGNHWSMPGEPTEAVETLDRLTTTGSFDVIDVGDHESFDEDDYIPAGWLIENEAVDADRVQTSWDAAFTINGPQGSSWLSSMTLTGVSRFVNVEQDMPGNIHRGRLWVSVETPSGTTHVVRLWANGSLVAEGQRDGDGAVTLQESNSSGLSGSCVLAWTADVDRGDDWLTLRWPAYWLVHLSKSALTYPRTPELIIPDVGSSSYVCLSAPLADGSWNYAVQSIGDDGVQQNPVATPSDSPKVIGLAPASPTWVGATGNATTGITLAWIEGEAGCKYHLFSSLKDEPPNLGDYASPVDWWTATGATTTSFTVPDYAPTDHSAAWATLEAAIVAAATAANAAWTAGPTGYGTALVTVKASVIAAILAFGKSRDMVTSIFVERVPALFDPAVDLAASLDGLTGDDWKGAMAGQHGMLLDGLSLMTWGEQGLLAFPGGQLPGGADPTGTTATGSGADGTSAEVSLPSGQVSMWELAQPLKANAVIRVICRAEKAGVEETGDEVLAIEIDEATGDVIQPRPNPARIESLSVNGLVLTVVVGCMADDEEASPTHADVYLVAASSAVDWASPSASGAVSARGDGMWVATVPVTAASSGWWRLAVASRSATGARGQGEQRVLLVSSDQPAAPANVEALVIRGSPLDPMEGAM